ncbi:hypothetical protein QFZ49_000373 [Streptomyces turgidiscabies]|uniref:ABC transporter substrate-binding protein n=1 Tax=Streptomyces turgidiscabies TaxID=85558 RepID=A0ABU0REQ2_9ACTN|nr:hypothetical protein [Streptomyces turgidiscabies]
MRRRRSAPAWTGACLLLLAPAAACGLTSGSPMADEVGPGSIGRGMPLRGAQLTVTSKSFTENLIPDVALEWMRAEGFVT